MLKKTTKKIAYSMMYRFENSDSFAEAGKNFKLLQEMEYWDDKLLIRLKSSVANNSQISSAWNMPRKISALAKKIEGNAAGTSYDITLSYGGTGDEIEGVKITLFNTTDDTNSNLLDFTDNMLPRETKTMTNLALTNAVIGADQIEMTSYFLDESGKEDICPNSDIQTF